MKPPRLRAAWTRSRNPLWGNLSPPQLLAGSFLLMILVGTLGLGLVPHFYVDGQPLDWIDALFMATSAVCVTGLVVVDTATHFTRLGQGFILLLIQVGGLGMITITTLILLSLGRRLSLRAESTVPQMPTAAPRVDARRMTRDIVGLTLLLEAIGGAILFFAFRPHFPVREAAWHALFHAISAFCNAGFSTFSDSLEGWAGAPPVLGTVMVLIVLGGIGFLTLEEVSVRLRTRGRGAPFRLSLHSRIVLLATTGLLLTGWGVYVALEWRGVLAHMQVSERLVNALFMSVTARTAGFNAVPYEQASDPTNFFTILLMAIGGSPGSTAGGLKTTTFFLIGWLAWSRIRGRTSVSIWSRSVPEETVQRAAGLFVVAFGAMTVAILLYAVFEAQAPETPAFLSLMFEAVSAFNTVGLSLGATETLSSASRVLTALLMFVGRIGPLAFSAALAIKARDSSLRYHFAREDVSVG